MIDKIFLSNEISPHFLKKNIIFVKNISRLIFLMRFKEKIIFSLLLLFLFLIIFSEGQQQKVNWYPSYAVSHKIPYGSYVAYHEAKHYFGDKLQDVGMSPYVYLERYPDAKGTFVFYNSSVTFGKTALRALLDWVKEGNNLFIASQNIEPALLDTLKLDYSNFFTKDYRSNLVLNFDNPNLSLSDTVTFDKTGYAPIFILKDSVATYNYTKLGHFEGNKDSSNTNFIKVSYGKGHILLHSFPYVFTNYFILNEHNLSYYNGLLSYINLKKTIYWSVNVQNGATSNGIFKYITENPGFLWAYRLLFVMLVLYILFEGKRVQRAIPLVSPPKNETLDFTRTIADMYIENKEHKRIALLHIKHFMDYLRHQLHIDIFQDQEVLKQKIAQKTKTDIEKVNKLFGLIEFIQNQKYIEPETVLKLEKQIGKIKN